MAHLLHLVAVVCATQASGGGAVLGALDPLRQDLEGRKTSLGPLTQVHEVHYLAHLERRKEHFIRAPHRGHETKYP